MILFARSLYDQSIKTTICCTTRELRTQPRMSSQSRSHKEAHLPSQVPWPYSKLSRGAHLSSSTSACSRRGCTWTRFNYIARLLPSHGQSFKGRSQCLAISSAHVQAAGLALQDSSSVCQNQIEKPHLQASTIVVWSQPSDRFLVVVELPQSQCWTIQEVQGQG